MTITKNKVGWTKFIAVLLIISAASYCASIILLPIGVPLIFASLALFKAAEHGEKYNKSENKDSAVESMNAFFHSFRICGIATLISIGLGILFSIIFIIGIVVAGASAGGFGEIENMLNQLMDMNL